MGTSAVLSVTVRDQSKHIWCRTRRRAPIAAEVTIDAQDAAIFNVAAVFGIGRPPEKHSDETGKFFLPLSASGGFA
jgi:hypothetical protein